MTQHFQTNRKMWMVAVKATFDLQVDGSLSISENQMEVLDEPVYFGDENESSLQYESDLVHPKERIDVILNATGYQQNDEVGNGLIVGFVISGLKKFLRIKGDRLWYRLLGIPFTTSPQTFKRQPIRYEYAYGGKDAKAKLAYHFDFRNTVGTGYSRRAFGVSGKRLPNIEYSKFPAKARFKRNRPAGFGVIAPHWYPRNRYVGTIDEKWEQERAPLLPDDFSPLYFQCAPEDQQLDFIDGGEEVILYNLLPRKMEFSFKLPYLSFSFATRIDNSVLNHPGALQTIIIEPDDNRLIMVWLTKIDCHEKENRIDKTWIECKVSGVKDSAKPLDVYAN
ncbi:DUF2169 domain-containing protein [bacterium]|nr:DUF2169 domain-containing protein [bacterium]